MRIAHIIMAHKNPTQLQRLISRLEHSNCDIYIHLDKKTSIEEFNLIKESNHLKFIKRRLNCNWGGFSFLNAIFTSLREIIDSEISYDFINLLSAQDYPLTSAAKIFEFLSANQGTNFISFDSSKSTFWWKEAKARYEKYHFTDINFKGKYLIQGIINKMAPARKFPLDMELYGSSKSSWWTISGECAAHINAQFFNNVKLRNFLKYSWGTDEFAIATLVMNSPYKHLTVNDNLRYIDFSQGNAHPKILGIEDFENLKTSNNLFARKFDEIVDDEILAKIDKECRT